MLNDAPRRRAPLRLSITRAPSADLFRGGVADGKIVRLKLNCCDARVGSVAYRYIRLMPLVGPACHRGDGEPGGAS